MIRTYSELREIEGIEERYAYLRVHAQVGLDTFGFERWLNQAFYTSSEWRQVRHEVIARDYGCDLGVRSFDVSDKIIIHHMNPIDVRDVRGHNPDILNPEFLISCSHRTHNAIHYGDASLLPKLYIPRRPGDTKLW